MSDDVIDLARVALELVDELPGHRAGRVARTVQHGEAMRAVVIALRDSVELAEHEAPQAGTLQVLHGRVSLVAGDNSWTLSVGEMAPIPHRRHSVYAHEDSAVLLTVCL
jgi:quercetin dioxygenase-like cupin family protein